MARPGTTTAPTSRRQQPETPSTPEFPWDSRINAVGANVQAAWEFLGVSERREETPGCGMATSIAREFLLRQTSFRRGFPSTANSNRDRPTTTRPRRVFRVLLRSGAMDRICPHLGSGTTTRRSSRSSTPAPALVDRRTARSRVHSGIPARPVRSSGSALGRARNLSRPGAASSTGARSATTATPKRRREALAAPATGVNGRTPAGRHSVQRSEQPRPLSLMSVPRRANGT